MLDKRIEITDDRIEIGIIIIAPYERNIYSRSNRLYLYSSIGAAYL